MKARVLVLAGCMIFAGAAAAQADCAGEIANLSGHGGAKAGGISKDGSTAPLEGAGTAAAGGAEQAAPSPDGKIAKEGGMPLEGTGGASQDAAMSQQDAEAQQHGGTTAAAEAAAAGGSGDALERAKAALAAGDETGCMRAVEEAKAQAD